MNRNQRAKEYDLKYGEIPRDYSERINYMIDKYHLSPSKMDQIIQRKRAMEHWLDYYDFKVILYEEPGGAKRPRFRIINKRNYHQAAIANPEFVHVYSPNAAEDHTFMHRLINDELVQLDNFIQTPCICDFTAYFKTPSYYNTIETFLCEIGLDRQYMKPDWDNIGKKYSDMYNSNVWLDDNLVVDGAVHKYYSILPRVEIHLRYLNFMYTEKDYNRIINRKDYKEEYPIGYLDENGEPNCMERSWD